MSTEKVIKLRYPIQSEGKDVTEITIPRLNARDLKVMDRERGEVGKMIALISRVANIPQASVKQIDGEDFSEIREVIESFLGNSQ